MPLYLWRRKAGANWIVRGRVAEQDIHQTTGTTDKALAEAFRANIEREAFHRHIFGERAVVTFAEAAASYLETQPTGGAEDRYVRRLLTHWCPGWASAKPDKGRWRRLGSIGQAEVDRCLAAVLQPGAKPATRARMISVVNAVLRHAARRGWCDMPALEKPRLPRGRTRWLTPAEAARLLDAASPHLRAICLFGLCTGARLSEILELEWPDVDLAERRATLRETKNGHDRQAALPEAAVVMLANLPHRDGAVFRRPDGLPYADRHRLEGGQVKTAMRGACARAGLPGVTPHVLRHSWASWLYALTRDLLLVRDEGGWLSARMVERYAHLAKAEIAGDVHLIWGSTHPRIGALPRTSGARGVHKTASA